MDLNTLEKTSGRTIGIYGPPGAGKTFSLRTLKGKTCLISLDDGFSVLFNEVADGQFDVKVVEDLTNLTEIVESDFGDYDNIVFENVTECYDSLLSQLGEKGKNDGVPEQRHYQQVQFTIRRMLKLLLRWAKRGKNVICVFWEQALELELIDDRCITKAMPSLGRKLPSKVCGLFDIIARLEVGSKSDNRRYRTACTNKIEAKDRIHKTREFAPPLVQALIDGDQIQKE